MCMETMRYVSLAQRDFYEIVGSLAISSNAQLITLGDTVENQAPTVGGSVLRVHFPSTKCICLSSHFFKFCHDVAIFERGIQGYSFGYYNFMAEKIGRDVVDFSPSATDGSLELDAAPSVGPECIFHIFLCLFQDCGAVVVLEVANIQF